MRSRLTRVGLLIGALILAASATIAIAQGDGSGAVDEPGTPEAAEAQEVCGGPPPCVTVNGFAYRDQAESDEKTIMRFDEAIAEHGTPADQCPEASQAFAKAGIEVDAFIGPCPPANAAPDRDQAQGLGSDPPDAGG